MMVTFMNPKDIKYEIVDTKEGLPTVVIDAGGKKIPLHSKFYPSKEADGYGDKFLPEKYDCLIVLGVGLGYHLLGLSNQINSYGKIILIDIIDSIEKEISQNKMTSFLNESGNIKFITGKTIDDIEDKLNELLHIDNTRGISVLEHTNSMRIFTDYYREIKKTIEKIINKKASSIITIKAFGKLYLKNSINNLKFFNDFLPVKSLFDKFNDYTVLIVIPGPSIENYIETLKKIQKKIFIIAVDSSLSLLQKNNIYPDFVISIDPQAYIYEHFQYDTTDEESKIAPLLLTSISANPAMIKKHLHKTAGAQFFLSLNTHPVSQIISGLFPQIIGTIDSLTGSVAGDALNTAFKLGFNRIGIMGLDFAFIDYKIYARGTAYQRRYSAFFSSRINPVESQNLKYIMKSSKGFKHRGKYTRRAFINYKESLEKLIKKEEISNLFNINSSGINIDGIPQINFDEFIHTHELNDIEKKNIIGDIIKNTPNLKSRISIAEIRATLSKKDILGELIKASLGEDANDTK
ncbi:motility associated factor glycosyltransferase family protein, partial [Spirochaetota bacterium]